MEVTEIKDLLESNEKIKRYYVSIIGCKYQCIKGEDVEDFNILRLTNQLMHIDTDLLDEIMDVFSKALEADELLKKVKYLEKEVESLKKQKAYLLNKK